MVHGFQFATSQFTNEASKKPHVKRSLGPKDV